MRRAATAPGYTAGMDAAVIRAMARWPEVPACWGWLALDERGRWRLGQAQDGRRGEVVRHRGLADYLARNYGAADDGAWFVQNGPQRVFCDLDAAPWVLHADDDGAALTHTGLAVARLSAALLDESGRLFAATEHGLALVGSDLAAAWLDHLRRADGQPADVADLAADAPLTLTVGDTTLPLERVRHRDLPARFGFQPAPRPSSSASTTTP